MSTKIEELEPKLLWKRFSEILRVPRPSKHEAKMIDYVLGWAKDKGFEVVRDGVGNVVVRVPASPGKENAPVVVLQGHLDMVCEKNADVEHDFDNDPIEAYVDGDWVKAKGTTLGADNGIGVAAAMAVAEDPDAVHGPLDLLFTVDEETGLTGASGLDPSIVRGNLLVNLDSEEDGAAYIGCAGGADTTGTFKLNRRGAFEGTKAYRIAVKGLRGGHSGIDIHENRANAIKLVARILDAAMSKGVEIDLVSLEGGSKHNAIPREAFADIRIPENQLEVLKEVMEEQKAEFTAEFGEVDPGLELLLEERDGSGDMPVNVHDRKKLIKALIALPHGVLSMSRSVPGLVETSTNLAVVKTSEEKAEVITSQRSSVMAALRAASASVRACLELAGAEAVTHDGYPGWKPNPESSLVKKTAEVYERLFGKPLALKAIHAGLECGLLIEKKPGMDAVSLGPEIRNAHSPDEMVQISSVARFYSHLKALLEELAK